jgi:type I restriction enzyme S subunit
LTYKPADICDDGVPVLRSNNIQNGKLDFTDLVRVNTPFGEVLSLQKNDILICARNGSRQLVGKCAQIPAITEPMTFGAFMAVYRSVCNCYVYYFLNTLFFRQIFENEGISTQINQLTQAMIKETLIPIPPFAEQNRIVSAIESAFAVIDEIERDEADLLSTVATAKSKILSLAIRGKLVPQDPANEPASVLLERIRKEREKLIKQGKIKRGKAENAIIRGDDNSYYLNNENITDRLPFKIPNTWAWVTLEQISDSISAGGDRPNKVSLTKTEQCFVPIFSNGISNDGLYGYTDTAVIMEPSLTVSARGTIGYSSIRTKPFVPIVRLITITPKDVVNLTYLHKALSHLIPQGEGSSIPQLTVPVISSKKIPLPPIAEQRCIVAMIEVAFEQLDSITTTLA